MLVHFPKDLSHRKAIYYMKKKYTVIQHFSARKGSQIFILFREENDLSAISIYSFLTKPRTLPFWRWKWYCDIFREWSFKVQRSLIAQTTSFPPFSQMRSIVVCSFSTFRFGFSVPTSSVSLSCLTLPHTLVFIIITCGPKWAHTD